MQSEPSTTSLLQFKHQLQEMDETLEVDVDSRIGEGSFRCQGKKSEKEVNGDKESVAVVSLEDHNAKVPPGIRVSLFDHSVENHFRAMDMISKLCEESEFECDQCEIQSLSSSMTFLREWRHFCYQPRTIKFAYQSETPQRKDVIGVINLPQFSSASVPKILLQKDEPDGSKILSELCKDYVMYVGGLVWALDWCPRVHQRHACDINIEFMAVAAHPPGSSYHKIGAPLTGRGVIQIWCLLNVGVKDQDLVPQAKGKLKQNCRGNGAVKLNTTQPKKPRGRPRKSPINESEDNLHGGISQDTLEQVSREDTDGTLSAPCEGVSATPQQNPSSSNTKNVKSSQPQKPRGRPRKNPIKESVDNLDGSNQSLQPLAVEFLEDSSKLLLTDGVFLDTQEIVAKGVSAQKQQPNPGGTETINSKSSEPQKPRGGPRKKPIKESVNKLNGSIQYLQPLAVEYPEDSSKSLTKDGISLDTSVNVSNENNCRNQIGTGQISAEQQQQNSGAIDAINLESSQPQKPRGRRRKKPINESVINLDCSDQYGQALSIQLPEDSSEMIPADGGSSITHEEISEKGSSRKRKGCNQGDSENIVLAASTPGKVKEKARRKGHFYATGLPSLTQNGKASLVNPGTSSSCGHDPVGRSKNIVNYGSFESDPSRYIPEDVALPRLVLCLAHNGKIAWDVKWRPFDSYARSKHRMGYLAVLLGNGALEVWDVPLPQATKVVYSACQKEGTDPRFIKLEPIFRCSILKCGDRQSIPLTVEWSASCPHDLILAGCHDGVVALWKFSANGPCKDTRPLLCFSADTAPIRALAWAPVKSDPESANVIVTAGHKGLKFWDIRDPFRPLWDLNTVQRIIYSLDWLPDPRCVVLSFDDGELRILSLLKAACDVPVTGKPFVGTQQQGLHSYYCSSSAIWSVQVSRLTGMVAYCCSDGTVLRFQLTTKAVEKDPLRNRAPHYLCGSLAEDESYLTIISPLPDIPFPMKKSSNKWGDAPRTKRGFLSISNQEKRAKEQMEKGQTSEEQPLALCYGNDTRSDCESNDTLVTQTSKQKLKTKSNSKKKVKTDQALICRDEYPENIQSEEFSVKGKIGNDEEIEVFPPKIVAMHRVRWNMNKGSERWLCYGGAGGIVRCQEIN